MAALIFTVTLLLVGCVCRPMPRPIPSSSWNHSAPSQDRGATQDPVLALLDYAHRLALASPRQREAAVKKMRDVVDHTPSGIHYARLAIALGTPHQHLYTPDEAARYAGLALDQSNAHWSPAARQYLVDYKRLCGGLATDSSDDARHIARLHAELRDARRKLRALAHIEDRLDAVGPPQ